MNEIDVSRVIIEEYTNKLKSALNSDVIIVGAGPSGMVSAYYLAKKGKKVVLIDKKLSPGGGIWGGGMLMNIIVVQRDALEILKDIGIKNIREKDGLYVIDAMEFGSGLCFAAVKEGVLFFNGMDVEDIILKENKVKGVVINWSPVLLSKLHVDPLMLTSEYVIDATGHDASLVNMLANRQIELPTSLGTLEGQKPMWVEKGEEFVVKNTGKVYPGLYVCGMSVCAVYGGPRMGPIFGGMILSGKKIADLIK